MLIKILIAIAALIAVFAIVVATRPAPFTISRSAIIAAPPSMIYSQVSDFNAWAAWSPWGKLDPAMKMTFAGAPGHVGASYEWTGNDKVGEGRMTLVEVQPPTMLNIRPFAATNECIFSFMPSGAGTLVSWTMNGNNNFMAKAFSMFVSMDKMVGGDFERGLAQLKTVAESAAQQQAPAPAPAAPAPATATPTAPAAK